MAIHFAGAELNVVNQELSKQNSQLRKFINFVPVLADHFFLINSI